MSGRLSTVRWALEHRWVQLPIAAALTVPAVATVGQYAASGYWGQASRVDLLVWPGVATRWALSMPVWLSMGAMLALYAMGVGWLFRRRTLSTVVLTGVLALIVANVAATSLNSLTGWRELQSASTMDLAGKANRAIFAMWHNPVWEELVFRGMPLALLLPVRRTMPRADPIATWCYYLLPALAFAAYHVPGHGPSRLVDTFILSLVFSWLALRFTFFAPLVLHYVFDAMMTLSLGKMPGIPRPEVSWLAAKATALNSAWSVAVLCWLLAIATALVVHRFATAPAARVNPSA
jgi:hypothetical protein